MTDDDLFATDDDDARDEVLRLFRGRGLRAAARAAIEVCEDPKAQASARATASGLILRATKLLDGAKDEDSAQPHEMDPAQLARALERAKAKATDLERRQSKPREQKKPDGIFG